MDRDELQSLSLDELRSLAEQRGVAHARQLPKSRIVDELGGSPWGQGHPQHGGVKGLFAELLHRVDRALGHSLSRLLSHSAAAPPSPGGSVSERGHEPPRSAAAGERDTGGGGVPPASGAGAGGGDEGPSGKKAAPGPAGEIVYPAVGRSSGQGQSSSAAVRGPQACAAAVDRANLSEEIARTYAAEGHRDEALAIYKLLLLERPGDPDLLARLSELEHNAAGEEPRRSGRPKLGPSPIGPHSEPWGMLDLEELPEVYGVNEVEVLFKDPWWSFVYWEVTDEGIEAARQQLGPASATARLVLRMFTTQPTHGTASRETRDVPLTWNHGRRYIDIPRPGALLRVAIGLLSAEGYFAPIAHSSLLRLPPPNPSAVTAVDWMQVAPPKGRGEQRERITIISRAVAHRERSLAWRVAAVVQPGTSASAGGHEGEGAEAEGVTYHVSSGSGPGQGGSGSGSGGRR